MVRDYLDLEIGGSAQELRLLALDVQKERNNDKSKIKHPYG
jgi:hypothetical protein